MKKLLLIIPMVLINISYASDNGKKLFELKCASCHVDMRPADKSSLIAPPAMGITRHVKMQYPKKEDAIKFMVDYIQNPSQEKALCRAESIKRFGLMPSQKGLGTVEEFTQIANYLYDNFGNRGQGNGQGYRQQNRN